MLSCFSRVWLCEIPWVVSCQAPLSVGFSRQEYWSGLPCPSPGDLPDPGMESPSFVSPTLAVGSFITSATWEDRKYNREILCIYLVHGNGNILISCSTISQPGSWPWDNLSNLWEFMFLKHAIICVCVYLVPCNFISSVDLCCHHQVTKQKVWSKDPSYYAQPSGIIPIPIPGV